MSGGAEELFERYEKKSLRAQMTAIESELDVKKHGVQYAPSVLEVREPHISKGRFNNVVREYQRRSGF